MKKEQQLKQAQKDIIRLELALEEARARLTRLQIESDSDSTNSIDSVDIQIGDYVTSNNAPYHNGKVEGFSPDHFWVYIRNKKKQRVKKAVHNVTKKL